MNGRGPTIKRRLCAADLCVLNDGSAGPVQLGAKNAVNNKRASQSKQNRGEDGH